MEKTKIDLKIVLLDIPNEKDACVERLISSTKKKKGVEGVHLVPGKEKTEAQL